MEGAHRRAGRTPARRLHHSFPMSSPPAEPQHRNSVDFAELFRYRSATHPPTALDNATQPPEPGQLSTRVPPGRLHRCANFCGFGAHCPRGSFATKKEDCPRFGRKPGPGVPALNCSCPPGRDRGSALGHQGTVGCLSNSRAGARGGGPDRGGGLEPPSRV